MQAVGFWSSSSTILSCCLTICTFDNSICLKKLINISLFFFSNQDAKRHIEAGAHGGVTANTAGIVEMIDTFDRPGKAFAKGGYAGTEEYAVGLNNKPGERIPKAGLSAAAGIGHARAEWSVFDAEAKGPNACAGIGASAGSLSAEAFARAEVASASAAAGPVKVKVGLAADTGVGVGLTGVEAKVLGTGVAIGRKIGVSFLGSGFEFNLW
uniref:Uncharacterized protein n=1 Tax=Stegastes partitus TaxID=144197 RepID=A0A3B5AGI8_9TELE